MKKKLLENICNNFGLIFSNTPRSYAYLNILRKNNIIPKVIIYLNNKKKLVIKKNKFFKNINLKKYCDKNCIQLKEFFKDNIDDYTIERFILKGKIKFFIYSGYGGKIIKSKKILNTKILLHSHPGILPEFRGSTTLFYSILKYEKIFCSTIILSKQLDNGNVLYCEKYNLPKDIHLINSYYDDFIRAKNMEGLFLSKKIKKIQSSLKKNNVFTIAHPFLRYMTYNKIKKKF